MQNPSESQHSADSASPSTHFGFQSVPESEKARKVAEVFHSVAQRYDVMNDFMSAGLHRVWKAFTIGRAAIRPGMKVLDIAGGTGDLAKAFAKRAGPTGEVWLTDINDSMLRVGRDRLTDAGLLVPATSASALAVALEALDQVVLQVPEARQGQGPGQPAVLYIRIRDVDGDVAVELRRRQRDHHPGRRHRPIHRRPILG